MICCLPVSPGNAWVTRIDWMISLSLRSAVRCGSWTSSGSSRRARTSCWVIVEAPRLSPRSEPSAADTIATGSKPAFSQNVLSSTAVVASSRTLRDLVEGDDLALGVAEAGQLDLAGPVVDDRLLGQDVVGQRRCGSARSGGERRCRRRPTAIAPMAPSPARNTKTMMRDASRRWSGWCGVRGRGGRRFERRTWTRTDSGSGDGAIGRSVGLRMPHARETRRDGGGRRHAVGCVATPGWRRRGRRPMSSPRSGASAGAVRRR